MKKLAYRLVATSVFFLVTGLAHGEVRWISTSGGKMGSNPVWGGTERAGNSYVCRDSAGVPGKMISGKCYVTHGGNEFENIYYQILDMAPGTYQWQRFDGRFPPNAILSGSEGRGKDIYVCRAPLGQGAVYIGKYIPWLSDCYYGVGGNERVSKTFEVLVKIGGAHR